MSFRVRLGLFLVAMLIAVQSLTAVLIYKVTRNALIDEGERQLTATAAAFVRQLDDISERVADNVQVLALDYALRSAVAERDRATVLSALRNHGRRIGAARMLLVDLDGTIRVDTLGDGAAPAAAAKFPYEELVAKAPLGRTTAVVASEGKAYWMVVVPINAPQPIALVAASIPIDDALIARIQKLSGLPKEIELAARFGDGEWQVVARGNENAALTAPLAAHGGDLPARPELVSLGGREYLALGTRLERAPQGAQLAAVLGYSIDEALRPYRSVATAWASLLALGLAAGLLGTLLIARSVSRPVELLASTARRIEAGDYTTPPAIGQKDEIGQLAAVFTKMTQAIGEREERIRYQAGHDAVSGLPNRLAAEAAVQRDLFATASGGGALMMIGLARITEVVQTMGHAISDRLMRDAGMRIARVASDRLCARASDTQFLVWLPGAGRTDAIAIAFRLRDALVEPYRENELAIDLGPAVGIALFPEHGREAAALLQHADVALFASFKTEEPVTVYDPATDPHRPERLSLMAELRGALDAAQLELYYQPKLNLATGVIDGAEGLVRWRHAKRGFVPPDDFIGLAEETGNIRRLTRWAIETGVAQAKAWSDARPFKIGINVSARDLDDRDMPRRVSELLSVHRLAPERVMLEMTESAVMGEPNAAIQVLKRVADQGIDIAIDDFGAGQSSFTYLRRLPIRELKIDKSFVQRLSDDLEDRTIVGSIVELGHRLGYRVTSEGVEDKAALDYLVSIGCDHAQGYYISKALPAAEFAQFLSKERWKKAAERA